MDETIELYELAGDLFKKGQLDECCSTYERAFASVQHADTPETQARRNIIAQKLIEVYVKLEKPELAAKYCKLIGAPLPPEYLAQMAESPSQDSIDYLISNADFLRINHCRAVPTTIFDIREYEQIDKLKSCLQIGEASNFAPGSCVAEAEIQFLGEGFTRPLGVVEVHEHGIFSTGWTHPCKAQNMQSLRQWLDYNAELFLLKTVREEEKEYARGIYVHYPFRDALVRYAQFLRSLSRHEEAICIEAKVAELERENEGEAFTG